MSDIDTHVIAPKVPEFFSDLNAADMLRHVQQNMDALTEDDPTQIVYIVRHMAAITSRLAEDIEALSDAEIGRAIEYLDDEF